MRKSLRVLCIVFFLTVNFLYAEKPYAKFEKDGSVFIENSLISLKIGSDISGKKGGITSWKFKPTGYEMVDLLYGQTDYLTGHLLGEIWDPVKINNLPGGRPDYGNLFIPSIGFNKDKRVLVLQQISENKYKFIRKFIVRNDLSTIEVHLKITNINGKPIGTSLRLHNIMSPGARGKYQRKDDILFLPSEDGVIKLDQSLSREKYVEIYKGDSFFNKYRENEPSRVWINPRVLKTPLLTDNWAIWVNKKYGDGMVFVVKGDNFLGFYNCPGITLEPVSKSFYLEEGKSLGILLRGFLFRKNYHSLLCQ